MRGVMPGTKTQRDSTSKSDSDAAAAATKKLKKQEKAAAGDSSDSDSDGDEQKLDVSAARKTYEINSRHYVCFDESNPITKEGEKEADPIPGTMSHYCFAALSVEGLMHIRRYSCYCPQCCTKQWEKCQNRSVVSTDQKQLQPRDEPGKE